MSKVTFPFTIITLKWQLFLRGYLHASGIRTKFNPWGCNHLMHSESFHCPKVTWLACCNSPWFCLISRNLELSVGNRKTEYMEMPGVCFRFSFCVADFGIELVLKRLLAQGLQVLSSTTYILWYARLDQSWSEWSTGAVRLGLTVFKLQ